jgi:hypothetical protein
MRATAITDTRYPWSGSRSSYRLTGPDIATVAALEVVEEDRQRGACRRIGVEYAAEHA